MDILFGWVDFVNSVIFFGLYYCAHIAHARHGKSAWLSTWALAVQFVNFNRCGCLPIC